MVTHGKLTVEIAWNLKLEGYDIYCDHGPASEKVGKIVSTTEKEYGKNDELSQLDIAIVEQKTNNAVILIEIEEKSDNPKAFLGDIFGVLLGKYIFFKRKELLVDGFTTLIVAGLNKPPHKERNQFIEKLANKIKDRLDSPNARIRKVIVESYKDTDAIKEELPRLLYKIIVGDV